MSRGIWWWLVLTLVVTGIGMLLLVAQCTHKSDLQRACDGKGGIWLDRREGWDGGVCVTIPGARVE